MRLANIALGTRRLLAIRDGGHLREVAAYDGQPVAGIEELLSLLGGRSIPERDKMKAGERVPEGFSVLPPVTRPPKIICVGLNYRVHAEKEFGDSVPDVPCLFAKFSSSLAGDGATLNPPHLTSRLDYEGELALVIGKPGRRIPPGEALSHVAGYTSAIDFTSRDLQRATSQWLQGKASDGYCPLGPCLVTRDEVSDPQDLTVRTWVNGNRVQDGHTSFMIFPVAELIAYISNLMTLEVGDLILTGTPEGVQMGRENPRWLRERDVVETEVADFGRLMAHVGPSV